MFRSPALPLARPALAVLIIFNALAVWNEYLLATLVFSDKSLMPLQRGQAGVTDRAEIKLLSTFMISQKPRFKG